MIKKVGFILLLQLFSLQILFAASVVIGSLPVEKNPNIAFGMPQSSTPQDDVLISRPQYVLSWNKLTHQPNWAAWKLSMRDFGSIERPSSFKTDPDLKELQKVDKTIHGVVPGDYHLSCFDRGHQVPSADRHQSDEDILATFYMTNMVPQTAYLNRGLWSHLETFERILVKKQNKTLYLIAGPIFDQELGAIGPDNDIKIPSKNFKIILIVDSVTNKIESTISVILPNITSKKTPPTDRETLCDDSTSITFSNAQQGESINFDDWKEFQAPVSEIEKSSGLHFRFD